MAISGGKEVSVEWGPNVHYKTDGHFTVCKIYIPEKFYAAAKDGTKLDEVSLQSGGHRRGFLCVRG